MEAHRDYRGQNKKEHGTIPVPKIYRGQNNHVKYTNTGEIVEFPAKSQKR